MTINSKRIIFFGDSITEMGMKPFGYVALIKDTLTKQDSSFEIIGAGISGNKVTDLQKRLKKDVIEKKPGIVVIYVGINDVWHFKFKAEGLTGTPKEAYENILDNIVTAIQSSQATVVLCTPSVIGEKADGTNEMDAMLDEYSNISRAIAKKRNVILVDLRNEFQSYLRKNNTQHLEKDILTYDGVHLNDSGNKLVADILLKTFRALDVY